MNPKEKDNEIIELTDEELNEILPMMILITAGRTAKSVRSISPILTRMPRSSHAPTMPPSESFLSMTRATLW